MSEQLSTQEMNKEHLPLIAAYWLQNDFDFMHGMGVDLSKLPDHDTLISGLRQQLLLPINERQSYALIWCLNDDPIGHCNLNPFSYGEDGVLHLHLWHATYRKKGIGSNLLEQSINHFFEHLKLKRIISEPYALNDAPNKTLKKVGFTKVKTYKTTPGSINYEQNVVRWEMLNPSSI